MGYSKGEYKLQCDIIAWVRANYPLFRISAIPNGGWRHKGEAVNMKWSGTLAGEPDLLLRLPNGITWNLEIKTSTGK